MPKEITDAVDRALVNLLVALSEFDMPGKPWLTKAEGRKYVVLAIKELVAVSPGFQGKMPKGIKVVGRSGGNRSAPLKENYPGSEGLADDRSRTPGQNDSDRATG